MNATRVVKLLRFIEWEGSEDRYTCPNCRCSQQHGHHKSCDLAEVLQDLEGKAAHATRTALGTLSFEPGSIEEEETIG